MNPFATALSRVAILVSILGAIGCERPQPQFRYLYQRPKELGPLPESLGLAFPTASQTETPAAGEGKAFRLAQALGIKLDSGAIVRRSDPNGETLSLKDPRYRLKVYQQSGMVRFRDTRHYNKGAAQQDTISPISENEARRRLVDVIQRLAKAGLVAERELLIPLSRVSFRKEGTGPGSADTLRGARPVRRPAEILDTRIFVPRILSGIGVSGHGVRVTFAKGGQIAGVDLLWRDLKISEKALQVSGAPDSARIEFERGLDVSANAIVEVVANDLVYYDPSMRDPAAFLEPVYLFVYRVKVPIEGSDKYVVSKLLHTEVSALNHGQKQLPSRRRIRLDQQHESLLTPRSSEAPVTSRTRESEEDLLPQPCEQIRGKVSRPILKRALAAPDTITGWGEPVEPTARFGAARGQVKTRLTLQNPKRAFHATRNKLLFKGNCP